MIQHTLLKIFSTLILFIFVISFVGCENKTEQKQEETKKEDIADDTSISQAEENESTDEGKITIPDLTGTWTGVFDKRATTLKISEQTDSSFLGIITINYREAINQEVKGTFSPTTLKMTMTDQLHSRFQGNYSGKLSNEFNNYSGTFTMKLDGSELLFNLNKK